jgi:hypothetical protein
MKRKLSIVLTIVMALTVLSVAPVSADGDKPINGKMDLTLEAEFCGTPFESPLVTWVGTVVIDGTTYGWADVPTDEPDFETKLGFMLFEEYWTIFTLAAGEVPTVALACNPALVVLDGTNVGRATPGGAATADGTVANAYGTFAKVAPESRMTWRGKVLGYPPNTPPYALGTEFKATLHILPPK